MVEYFIGLMSGTSLDGIDAAIVAFDSAGFRLVGTRYEPYDADFRGRLSSVCFAETVEMRALGALDAELGERFGTCVIRLLADAQFDRLAVTAIGSHGQTVFHNPCGAYPFSIQIGDPNRIAEISGIPTVADFRRRDMALGGQGAPLVPAFHQYAFGHPQQSRVIVNIGGIANLTVLSRNGSETISGFDSGPGNTLMDYWIQRQLELTFDKDGAWARSGRLNQALLTRWLDDDYFRRDPPKSTGQEYFSAEWLARSLDQSSVAEDIQATLCHLTAKSIVQAVLKVCSEPDQIIICGGGARNAFLMELIQSYSPGNVTTTAEYGLDPDWVEAAAFAWLARRTVQRQAGNVPMVTGARAPRVLGGWYAGVSD